MEFWLFFAIFDRGRVKNDMSDLFFDIARMVEKSFFETRMGHYNSREAH